MLDRKIRRKVESAFYNYRVNIESGAESLAELAENGLTAKYGAVGGGSNIGNPTESKAIKLVEGCDAVLWCRVVEKTLEHFHDTGKDTLIRLRYFDKLSERRVCERLYIDRRTMFFWIEDVITFAIMVAIQYRLLKIL